MVKPVGSLCNLDCAYCYYLHKMELLGQPRNPRMADRTLAEHIRQYIEAQDGDEVIFSWQGGEPTLMGLDFFRRIIDLQRRYARKGQAVLNDLQTNGTLLDDEWGAFLAEHHFLVGISIDGPERLHDRYRVTKGGKPTWAKVIEGLAVLKRHGVRWSAMCVINYENAKYPLEVFRFLADELGATQIQFIPCVEPTVFKDVAPQRWDPARMPRAYTPASRPREEGSVVTDWSVDAEDWGNFLAAVWDDWLARYFGKIHLDHFETAIAQAIGLPAQRCVNAEFCGKALAVEHTGDVYSCDHYVYPEFHLGNLHQQHWGEMAYSVRQRQFGFAKRDRLTAQCVACPHLKLCGGECPKNRFIQTHDGEPGLSYLCPGLQIFFQHIRKDLPDVVRRVLGLNKLSPR